MHKETIDGREFIVDRPHCLFCAEGGELVTVHVVDLPTKQAVRLFSHEDCINRCRETQSALEPARKRARQVMARWTAQQQPAHV